jgi:hypothetical protein
MALHAKAKAEAGYRFYALYDKISREDILAHAYAQCRSNKGAPGADGQNFADIDAYGVQRWLGELALTLRQETYRPDPIRRVFIPKANGKLRPLGISTLRDRVCMKAAMRWNRSSKPIFHQNSMPTVAGATPNRRWSRWRGCCTAATALVNYRPRDCQGFVVRWSSHRFVIARQWLCHTASLGCAAHFKLGACIVITPPPAPTQPISKTIDAPDL